MFGCVVAGRRVQTNLVQVDELKFSFEIDDAASVNHFTIFLNGDFLLPDGFGAGSCLFVFVCCALRLLV